MTFDDLLNTPLFQLRALVDSLDSIVADKDKQEPYLLDMYSSKRRPSNQGPWILERPNRDQLLDLQTRLFYSSAFFSVRVSEPEEMTWDYAVYPEDVRHEDLHKENYDAC